MYPCEVITDGLVHGDPLAIITGGCGVVSYIEPKKYKRRDDYTLSFEEAPSFGLSFNSYIGKVYKSTFIKTKKEINVDFIQ